MPPSAAPLRCFYFHLPLSRSTTPGLERRRATHPPDYPTWILEPTYRQPTTVPIPSSVGNLLAVDGERGTREERDKEEARGGRERERERATLARFLSYLFGVVLGCAARRTSGKMAAGSEPRCRYSRPLLAERRARAGGGGGGVGGGGGLACDFR